MNASTVTSGRLIIFDTGRRHAQNAISTGIDSPALCCLVIVNARVDNIDTHGIGGVSDRTPYPIHRLVVTHIDARQRHRATISQVNSTAVPLGNIALKTEIIDSHITRTP